MVTDFVDNVQTFSMKLELVGRQNQNHFPDLNAQDLNFIRSVWRCDLSQMACMRTFGSS